MTEGLLLLLLLVEEVVVVVVVVVVEGGFLPAIVTLSGECSGRTLNDSQKTDSFLHPRQQFSQAPLWGNSSSVCFH